MKSHLLFIGVLFLLFLSACAVEDVEGDLLSTLPEPEVRVLQQPTATKIIPTETIAITTIQDPGTVMAFGIESHQTNFEDHAALIGEPGLTMMRHNGLLWPNVEPIEGQRDWTAASDLEEKLERAAASGLSTILIVRGTPDWAQLVPGSFCGPIHPEKLSDYADFMVEAVSRYSQPPYNVKYWELGNEPDVDPLLVPSRSVFGCWGNYLAPYYGGGYYADMLKVVYPAIKSADPEAKVLIGGLLLDCDPNLPPEGKDCSSGNFLEGILSNGGGDYFDMVSFHGYTPYFGPTTGFPYELYMDEHNPSWEHLGGVIDGKINFIRQVMDAYQIAKPIYHTEGALMCAEYNPTDCDSPDELFFDAQADYAIRMFVRNWANGIAGTIWYQFEGPGWRYSGLLDENQNPKPVYEALDFLTKILSQTAYVGENTQFESLQGYEFSSPEKRILVLWSPEQVDIPIRVPDNTIMIFDKFGNEITPSGEELIINSPIYLEMTP